ncbi:hypothetical protein BABINDRAFT_35167 [Babjeviella inositovora NRRL Y-12698]|uniref:Uncharacterized protein n=1 Tax=Babjeviella inositovora NRRL Y-12698 TaxID=984486 RepID=A0A1E3QSU4_9ASCO|nr:uncharacterized protein BABINDRAFT_35167 [Babjeviella inositovora NRRL Y-12698]ODQ80785.1 hypothetical protein BABINDRAFT_35167 [Babjeviella inositovora NRRL Y-12698]
MSLLILDPLSLSEQLPDASVSNVHRLRIIAQVLHYDEQKGDIYVTRVPLFPLYFPKGITAASDEVQEISRQWMNNNLHNTIIDFETLMQMQQNFLKSQITVNLTAVLSDKHLLVECVTPGSVVEIEALYDGEVRCIDCFEINSSLVDANSTYATLSILGDLTDIS